MLKEGSLGVLDQTTGMFQGNLARGVRAVDQFLKQGPEQAQFTFKQLGHLFVLIGLTFQAVILVELYGLRLLRQILIASHCAVGQGVCRLVRVKIQQFPKQIQDSRRLVIGQVELIFA